MRKRLNENFLSAYLALDNDCAEKFGAKTGGVTEYINRLNGARFAPGRDACLPRLVKYRNIRNRFAHEPDALRRSDEVTKADIAWIRKFDRDVIRRKDPISVYLRKARRYARHRKIVRGLLIALAILIVLAIAAFILYLKFKTE